MYGCPTTIRHHSVGCRLLVRKFATALPFRITGKVYQLQSFEQLLETLPASETPVARARMTISWFVFTIHKAACARGWCKNELYHLPHAASIEVRCIIVVSTMMYYL